MSGITFFVRRRQRTDLDEEHFKYASIGTENQDGIPYWIWMILPRVFPEKLPGPGGYTSLGLTWEEGKEMPVGFTKKTIGFERVGINCAACHTATYRVGPRDKPIILPAGPSNKFDSQAYLRFLSACASDPRFNADNLLQQIYYNHKFSLIEGLLYRYVSDPADQESPHQAAGGIRLDELASALGAGADRSFQPRQIPGLETAGGRYHRQL